jgi:LSD1 subclass zinc finger protein
MTEIKQLTCPNCGGLLNAPPGATRVTCSYCGADLAVDLDKEEAMLYALDQQERSKEKDRFADEQKELYAQYMTTYNELNSIDIEMRQRELMQHDRVVRNQLKELGRRREELVQGLSAVAGQIAKIDMIIHPGIVTQLPLPASRRPASRWPAVLRALVVFLVVVAVIVAVALKTGIGSQGTRNPAGALATATAFAGSPPPPTGSFYAKETSHSVTAFARPFTDLGGVAVLGFPVTQAFIEQDPQDGVKRWVQYFEKAVLEYHPDLPKGQEFQLSRVGAWRLAQKYPTALPEARPLLGANSFRFKETGFTVTDPFLAYWHQHGELVRFGYPISPPFNEQNEVDGKTYLVQYFERAVMEYHPEIGPPYDVQLTAVGTQRLKQLYPTGPPNGAANPVADPGTP